MHPHLRIVLTCPDGRGLLAAVAGRLFELGGDVGDASFTLLGAEAQLSCVVSFPEPQDPDKLRAALADVPSLATATVSVEPFYATGDHPEGSATHVVRLRGQDRPGLLARLAEGFVETGANVARMDAERLAGGDYVMRFEIWVPPGRAGACLANAANDAERMGLRFEASEA